MYSSLPLLAIYCLLIAISSLAGGAFPILSRLSHTGMQISISFVGGVMLGVGMLHMLPHAAQTLGDATSAATWMLVGFVVMFFLLRFAHFHHHETADQAVCDDPAHVHHSHEVHAHGDLPLQDDRVGRVAPITWTTFAVGLGLHSMMDGVALAASVHADHPAHRFAGLATFLAILLHKPFDSLTITLLMAGRGASVEARQTVNLVFALVVPLGVALFMLSTIIPTNLQQPLAGLVLAFAAGGFLCIASSDLLPEVQFHSHDRIRLSCALLAGILLAWLIEQTHVHM